MPGRLTWLDSGGEPGGEPVVCERGSGGRGVLERNGSSVEGSGMDLPELELVVVPPSAVRILGHVLSVGYLYSVHPGMLQSWLGRL